jgi:hypothetical protein
MIGGVQISEIGWETWWMLLSGGAALVGLIGWQLVQMVVGMFAIAKRKKTDPKSDRQPTVQELCPATDIRNCFRPVFLLSHDRRRHHSGGLLDLRSQFHEHGAAVTGSI